MLRGFKSVVALGLCLSFLATRLPVVSRAIAGGIGGGSTVAGAGGVGATAAGWTAVAG